MRIIKKQIMRIIKKQSLLHLKIILSPRTVLWRTVNMKEVLLILIKPKKYIREIVYSAYNLQIQTMLC